MKTTIFRQIVVVTLIVMFIGWGSFLYVYFKREATLSRMYNFDICLSELVLENGELPLLCDFDALGVPTVSWRFRRYLEQMPIPRNGADFRSSWNSSVNQPFHGLAPGFICFSKNQMTSIMAVGGKGTAFDGMKRRCGDVPDDTILLIEVYQSRIHWMEPVDIAIDDLVQERSSRSLFPSSDSGCGFCVGFADGAVWYLRQDVPMETVRDFCLINRSARMTREQAFDGFVISKMRGSLSSVRASQPAGSREVWGRTLLD